MTGCPMKFNKLKEFIKEPYHKKTQKELIGRKPEKREKRKFNIEILGHSFCTS